MPGLWPAIRAMKRGVDYAPFGTLFVVNGTMEPTGWGPGYAGDLGRTLWDWADGMWLYIGIAYPAAVAPMGPSYRQGVVNLVNAIKSFSGRIALAGYSQGALVTDTVWRDHILNPKGDLHDRLHDVVCIANWGDPMRAPGIANGNVLAGHPIPKKVDGCTTGGIAGPNCLKPEETPDFLLSFDNDGDIYASSPVGDTPWIKETAVGHDMTMIYSLVQDFSGTNLFNLAKTVLKLANFAGDIKDLGTGVIPMIEGKPSESAVIAVVQAVWNGGMFVGKGIAPHNIYAPETVGAAAGYMIDLAHRHGYF
jgi:hypothetical protein